jgi:hypothetical protein
MRPGRAATLLAPVGAAMSAMTVLACCLPWGIGAALGAMGLSIFFARFQAEFLVLSVVLLGFGLIQLLRFRRSCRRPSRLQMALWMIAAAIVIAVALFPEWVAGLLAFHHP